MSMKIRYPNITGFSEKEQIKQIRSFLHQLVDQLNYELPATATTKDAPSKPPVMGVDYFTPEDKAAMVKEVKNNLGIAVARFIKDSDAGSLTCATHTAREIFDLLEEQGVPVIGLVFGGNDHTCETVTVSLRSGSSIVVGCTIADGAWSHYIGDSNCYVDGNASNKTIGNELWWGY